MTDTRNETTETAPKPGLTVQWGETDLPTFQKAAEVLSAREHGDYTKTDIIRMGARRFAAEILAAEVA
jgi:hypothetical protein